MVKYSRIGTENGYGWIASITSSQLALMLYMTEQCNTTLDNGVVIFSAANKRQFAEHIGVTFRSVDKMLTSLIDKGFIVSVGIDTYMVNPHLVSNGHVDYYDKHYKHFSNIMYSQFSPIAERITRYGLVDFTTGECSEPMDRIDVVYEQACDIAGEFSNEGQ